MSKRGAMWFAVVFLRRLLFAGTAWYVQPPNRSAPRMTVPP
jgi:hypothetical protein